MYDAKQIHSTTSKAFLWGVKGRKEGRERKRGEVRGEREKGRREREKGEEPKKGRGERGERERNLRKPLDLPFNLTGIIEARGTSYRTPPTQTVGHFTGQPVQFLQKEEAGKLGEGRVHLQTEKTQDISGITVKSNMCILLGS